MSDSYYSTDISEIVAGKKPPLPCQWCYNEPGAWWVDDGTWWVCDDCAVDIFDVYEAEV